MEPLVYDSTLHGSCVHGPETLETSNPSHGQSLSIYVYIYISYHVILYNSVMLYHIRNGLFGVFCF